MSGVADAVHIMTYVALQGSAVDAMMAVSDNKKHGANMGTNHKHYLDYARSVMNFRGKRVLEIGGCTPPDLIRTTGAVEWFCADLNRSAVAQFKEQAGGDSRLQAECIDAAKMGIREHFDIVYSINCFEHISNLRGALSGMFDALKPGGRLFTIFGPIWSSDVGHHLSVGTADCSLSFAKNNPLKPWEHLLVGRNEMKLNLAGRFGEELAEKAADFIYDFHDLNRLMERDYDELLEGSGFGRVLVIRRRFGTAPPIDGASNTRELLWFLKKGSVNPLEQAFALGRFATGFALRKLRGP